jgi:hypothetical protein
MTIARIQKTIANQFRMIEKLVKEKKRVGQIKQILAKPTGNPGKPRSPPSPCNKRITFVHTPQRCQARAQLEGLLALLALLRHITAAITSPLHPVDND